MYDDVTSLLAEMDLSLTKLVGFGFDGASAMRGIHEGLFTNIWRHAHDLIDIHRIAH